MTPSATRALAFDVALATGVFGLKILVSLLLLRLGFRQISDDDYARVVIAQTFANTPRLDPSGTSWLPFPFWMTGSAMLVLGRSLAVARGVALVASALASAMVFVVLRRSGAPRSAALLATLAASLVPWAAWSGACPVPEGFAGPLVAVGVFSLLAAKGDSAGGARTLAWGAGALAIAALSRYETWPACACFAAAAVHRARRDGHLPRVVWPLAISLAAPVAWVAWNQYAHGDALHFLARVTRFRQAHGDAGVDTWARLSSVPRALWAASPESVVAGLALAWLALRDRRLRWPLLTAAAIVTFLIVGELGDGAPTHHRERALLAIPYLMLGGLACGCAPEGGASERLPRAHVYARRTAGLVVAATWLVNLPSLARDFPGTGAADRTTQVARGTALRALSPEGFAVSPCAFEHFALMAAYGAPERVRVAAAPGPREPAEECPKISPGR